MTKHEIEYEDAPSGYATFYNYKEPLMKYDKGYGFLGAVVFDGESDKIQCALCGDWFVALAPHLRKEHNMKVDAYKDELGLFQTTALIGEKMRAKLIASGLNKRLQNLRQTQLKKYKMTDATREKIRATCKKNAEKAEGKNLRGTCPEQLLDRLQKAYQREGENFSFRRHVNFDYLLKKTYGSVKEACRLAGVPYRKPGQIMSYANKIKYTDQQVIDFVKEFATRFHRLPVRRDFYNQGKSALWDKKCSNESNLGKRNRVKGRYNKLCSRAMAQLDEYKKTGEKLHFTKEELLGFLRKFEKGNGRKPSISDGKRGLIPPLSRYYYHFGKFRNAVDLAFK